MFVIVMGCNDGKVYVETLLRTTLRPGEAMPLYLAEPSDRIPVLHNHVVKPLCSWRYFIHRSCGCPQLRIRLFWDLPT